MEPIEHPTESLCQLELNPLKTKLKAKLPLLESVKIIVTEKVGNYFDKKNENISVPIVHGYGYLDV